MRQARSGSNTTTSLLPEHSFGCLLCPGTPKHALPLFRCVTTYLAVPTLCLLSGVEEAMSTMKAGGKRRIIVPPSLGFGEAGSVLRPTEHVPEKQGVIPGGAELEYELELLRVSIPPS